MRGLAFSSDQSFARTFPSLMPDFARWCWLIDAQSGPFALTSLPGVQSRRLEQSLASYELDAPALVGLSLARRRLPHLR